MTTVTSAARADNGPGAADAAPEPDRKTPGRPRSARADEAITEAMLDLLAEGLTFEALTIEAVAARAGVGKATIYRRWPNKESMLVDAIARLKGELPTVPGTSLRDDLVAVLRPVGTIRSTRAGQIMPCLVPELRRSPELQGVYHRAMEPRRELLRQVLRTWRDKGELRADLDIELAAVMLIGPLLAQNVLFWNPNLPREGLPERLVDGILAGIAAR
ncbi:TetR/AcrR family transcriptional regulator [Luedemannella flava]|uniref:TetR/AcrR family transcriptional regulator n=1 Tax=Luedemannella flava TaxID=349316 RepID=UPI0031DD3B2D